VSEEIEKRVGMAKALLERLLQRKIPLLAFVIFGSTARGRVKRESDIDLLLIVEKRDRETWKRVHEEAMKVEGVKGPFLSFIMATESHLRENPLILLDMTEENICLYDPQGVFKKLISDMKKMMKKLGSKRIWLDEDTWYWEVKPDWKPGEVVEIRL